MAMQACNPALGGDEDSRIPGLAACQPSSRFRDTPGNKAKTVRAGHLISSDLRAHPPTNTSTCAQTCTHISNRHAMRTWREIHRQTDRHACMHTRTHRRGEVVERTHTLISRTATCCSFAWMAQQCWPLPGPTSLTPNETRT